MEIAEDPETVALAKARGEIEKALKGEGGWEYNSTKENVELHFNMFKMPSGLVMKFTKGITELDVAAATASEIVTNFESMALWDKQFHSGRVVEEVKGSECERKFVYMRFKAPWPVWGRDFCNVSEVYKKKDGAVDVVAVSRPHGDAPEASGLVRANLIYGGWVFEPIRGAGDRCKATYITAMDPNGTLPLWLVNQVANDTPMCLAAIAKFIKKYPDKVDSMAAVAREKMRRVLEPTVKESKQMMSPQQKTTLGEAEKSIPVDESGDETKESSSDAKSKSVLPSVPRMTPARRLPSSREDFVSGVMSSPASSVPIACAGIGVLISALRSTNALDLDHLAFLLFGANLLLLAILLGSARMPYLGTSIAVVIVPLLVSITAGALVALAVPTRGQSYVASILRDASSGLLGNNFVVGFEKQAISILIPGSGSNQDYEAIGCAAFSAGWILFVTFIAEILLVLFRASKDETQDDQEGMPEGTIENADIKTRIRGEVKRRQDEVNSPNNLQQSGARPREDASGEKKNPIRRQREIKEDKHLALPRARSQPPGIRGYLSMSPGAEKRCISKRKQKKIHESLSKGGSAYSSYTPSNRDSKHQSKQIVEGQGVEEKKHFSTNKERFYEDMRRRRNRSEFKPSFLNVKVIGSKLRSTLWNSHVRYVCEVKKGLHVFRVQRRYSEFNRLHDALRNRLGAAKMDTFNFPPKTIFHDTSEGFQQARKFALNAYMHKLLSDLEVLSSRECRRTLLRFFIPTQQNSASSANLLSGK